MVLGADEIKQGKVRIKELGLQEGHAEKEGVLVDLSVLVSEIKKRFEADSRAQQLDEGLESLKVAGEPNNDEPEKEKVLGAEKPAEESPSQETIGALPAS